MGKNAKHDGTFKIGNVGGDVTIQQAGGDIVQGNKSTTETHVQGLQNEQDKQNFISQLEALRGLLREVKQQVESSAALDENSKDALVLDIMQHLQALNSAKQQTQEIAPGTKAAGAKSQGLLECIEGTKSLMDKAQQWGEKAAELTVKLAAVMDKVTPLIVKARTLLGFGG